MFVRTFAQNTCTRKNTHTHRHAQTDRRSQCMPVRDSSHQKHSSIVAHNWCTPSTMFLENLSCCHFILHPTWGQNKSNVYLFACEHHSLRWVFFQCFFRFVLLLFCFSSFFSFKFLCCMQSHNSSTHELTQLWLSEKV